MSDKNIFIRLKRYKDKQAFMAAYDQYLEPIYRFVYFKTGNAEEEAKDLTSQVFVKAWTYVRDGKLNDSNDYQSLKSFLYKIARNSVIDYYRSNKQEVSLDEMLDNSEEGFDLQDEQAKNIDTAIDFTLIQQKLPQLKSEYRGIIVMRYINQLSVAEIADILGKNKATVRVTIFRALAALRELVEPGKKKKND